MTPAEWERQCEQHVEIVERLRDRTDDEKRGLLHTLRDIRALPSSDLMAASATLRCRALNEWARSCYRLRNEADGSLALDYEAVGDTYYGRALAMLAEWEA